MPIKRKYQVALLGTGRAGKFHIQSLQMIPELRLAYIIDVNEDRAREAAEANGCLWATGFEAALESSEIDAVIIASPTHAHYSQITQALEAGKAVFTEKPLGTSLQEIDDCFELAQIRERPLFVGFNRRFDPTFSSLAASCHDGVVGTPHLIRITSRDSPLPTLEYISHSHGIFHDCIVHDLDMLRYISREDPVEIYAVGSSFVEGIGALDDYDNVLVSLRYDSGLLASIDVNRYASYGYDQRIEVFGAHGMVQAENRAPTATVISDQEGITRPTIEYSFPTRYRDAYRIELENFLKCLNPDDNFSPSVSHHDVRMSYILSELGESSARSGKPMRVESHPGYRPAPETRISA